MNEDLRPVFPTLEGASGEGIPAREVKLGDDPAGKSGSLGFAFRDSAGNIVMPTLTGDGKVPVSFDASGTPKKARGEVVAGSPSGTFVAIANVSLSQDTTISRIMAHVSCRRAAYFQLIHRDDSTVTVLDEAIVDSGQYSFEMNEGAMEFDTPATGAQSIEVRAFNLDNQQSALRANVSCIEVIG